MPRIIAIANRKGGVGKTTTTVNVATAMAAAGKKVLVVDLDPQGNATTSMGVNKSGRMPSSYEVLLGEKRINEAVVWTEIPNFSLVPSSPDLAGAEVLYLDGRTQTDFVDGNAVIVYDLRVVQGVLDLHDLCFHDRLFVLCLIVFGVLGKVALRTCLFQFLCHFCTAAGYQKIQFFPQLCCTGF